MTFSNKQIGGSAQAADYGDGVRVIFAVNGATVRSFLQQLIDDTRPQQDKFLSAATSIFATTGGATTEDYIALPNGSFRFSDIALAKLSLPIYQDEFGGAVITSRPIAGKAAQTHTLVGRLSQSQFGIALCRKFNLDPNRFELRGK